MGPAIDPFTVFIRIIDFNDIFQDIPINKFQYLAKQAYFYHGHGLLIRNPKLGL